MDEKDWRIVDLQTGFYILLIISIILLSYLVLETPITQKDIISKDFPEIGISIHTRTTNNPCAAYCQMDENGNADIFVNRAPRFIWYGTAQ